MFILKMTNKDGVQQSDFETKKMAEDWITNCEEKGLWGVPGSYTVELEDLSESVKEKRGVAEAKEYLELTDRAVITHLEKGESVPDEMRQKRAIAREKSAKTNFTPGTKVDFKKKEK